MTIESEEIDTSAATVRGGLILIDQHLALFLQPCDTTGSSLILVKLTRPENYTLWSSTTRVNLLGKSELGFVDGRYPKEKFDITFHKLWEKCIDIVLSRIMNSISYELLSGTVCASSAHKVWMDLKERFDKVNGSRVLYLYKQISALTQGISFVPTYFSTLKELWAEFDALMLCLRCGCEESKKYVEQFQYQRLLQFLMGFNESYSESSNQIGHARENCYKLNGYPPDFKAKKKFGLGNAVHYAQDSSTSAGNNQAATVTNFACSSLWTVKGIGREDDGLYILYSGDVSTSGSPDPNTIPKPLVPRTPPPTVNMIKNHKIMDVALWNKILGHTPEKTLRNIAVFQDCECKNTTESCTSSSSCLLRLFCDTKGLQNVGIHSKTFTVSRDVLFKEDVFPLKYADTTSSIFLVVDLTSVILSYPENNSSSQQSEHIPFANSLPGKEISFNNFASEIAADNGDNSTAGDLDVSVSIPTEPSLPFSSPSPVPEPHHNRKSTRASRPPIWMRDYVTHNKGKAQYCYPISPYVSYDNVSSYFGSALAAYSVIVEPKTFSEVVKDPSGLL
ncbi:uncharacterized protein [Nicotiana sylvestris]|uniref:uncharacterized protein n=1 Tax=Nicotiana sylvestris TaxID=4096 RepID=UPI00388CB1DC